MKKVLVLGCGEMGEEAIPDLYRSGKFGELAVGTRSLDKARQLLSKLQGQPTKVSAFALDLQHAPDLPETMKGFDVVVNCVGPNYKYEVLVAKAAIRARVPLVDINDDYTTTLEMFDLDEAARKSGIAIILGLGASPGVNNVLVRAAANQLDDVEEIHTAWVMSGSDPGGPALSYHLLYSLSGRALTYQDGKFVEVRSFVDGKERLEFPEPVGAIDVYYIGHPESITLARVFKGARVADDKATFHPAIVNDWIVGLGTMAREAGGPVRVNGQDVDPWDFAAALLHQRCHSLKDVPQQGALRVEVKGRKGNKTRKVFFSSAGRIAQGTGIPASIGAQMLVEGKVEGVGVLPPEACIEPTGFLYELLSRNIGKLNGWVEDL
jgi:saccharopine dehydrogenase-like NADP-dependent oxidoreductase